MDRQRVKKDCSNAPTKVKPSQEIHCKVDCEHVVGLQLHCMPLHGDMCTNWALWGRLVLSRVLALVVNPPLVLELAEILCQVHLLASYQQMPRVHTGLVGWAVSAVLDTLVTIAGWCALRGSHRQELKLIYPTSLQVCHESMCIEPALL